MSFFPISHYRLFNDPFERFFGDQLHFFDPWRDFDLFARGSSSFPSSFRWINEPYRMNHSSSSSSSSSSYHRTWNNTSGGNIAPLTNNRLVPTRSEKFRVQLDVTGFTPETIKTRIEGRRVIVEAKEEDRQANGDFSIREIRKTYDLPDHADTTNFASFVTPNNMLVIEIPIHVPRIEQQPLQTSADPQELSMFGQFRDPLFDYPGFMASTEFRPRIVNLDDGQKQVKLTFAVKNYRPEQIKVSIKNNELLVQAENIYNDGNRSGQSFLTKSITLPPGTQVDRLKSYLTPDGQLEVEAPFIEPSLVRSIQVQQA